MKTTTKIVLGTTFAGIILCGVVYGLFLKRTPERLLNINFNISLRGFDYSVETFEEQWYPNGDGSTLVVYKFDRLTLENIEYLKGIALNPLPISEIDLKRIGYNKIPEQYFYATRGYYIYEPLNTQDIRDYKIFILDIESGIAVLYFQYM